MGGERGQLTWPTAWGPEHYCFGAAGQNLKGLLVIISAGVVLGIVKMRITYVNNNSHLTLPKLCDTDKAIFNDLYMIIKTPRLPSGTYMVLPLSWQTNALICIHTR